MDFFIKGISKLIKPSCKRCNFKCYAIRFQQNFKNWTSNNDDIDKFIQNAQLSTHESVIEAPEWIPYDRFYDIEYIENKKVYKANWIDGHISHWDYRKQDWERNNNTIVTLKELNGPKIITLEFMNEQNFKNWTSGNNDIDNFIQDTQLSAHHPKKALEWIPYDRFINIKKIRSGKTYRANWIDGNIIYWDCRRQNWKRHNNMIVLLIGLNSSKVITLEFMNEIKIDHEFYGITQNLETKCYMMVLNDKCKHCKYICNSIHFQQNFKNWTSGNNDIDNFIQDTQLSAHLNGGKALEWIPYDRFINIKKIRSGKTYRANWIDGNIIYWDCRRQNWKRHNNTIVTLKELNGPKIITLEFMNEQNFKNWTSGNNDIDNFIQDTQLSAHLNGGKALEWIPYDRFINIKKIRSGKTYRANWIDGNIIYWDCRRQNWKRHNNMIVLLIGLNSSKVITLEFMNEIKIDHEFYGITQNLETKCYMMVLNDKCKHCKYICNSIHFQQNFKNWTSGNNDIDNFIQDTQLSAHKDVKKALEWIPYNRFNNIEKIGRFGKANWIDGCIFEWNGISQNWIRVNQNMIVTLKELDSNSKNITLELMKWIGRLCGITQNPETKNYMMVLNDECKICDYMCNTIHFQQNFENWTSGNDDIDKLIQDTQLLVHNNNHDVFKIVLEWIPYDRFYDIKYIAKGGFGKVYRANWIDGYIINREDKFMNEVTLHNKGKMNNAFIIGFYGITQDPETKNYMMVLDYAEDGSLRNYLDKEYNKLKWNKKIDYMYDIIIGLERIHEKELIHRDLHIGNILKLKYDTTITDLGLSPEILRGQNYTKVADIYSFGIIMYEIISGLPPYCDLSHDKNLAIKICKGIRPRFNIKVLQLIVYLIKRCLDADPLNRPIAREVKDIINKWRYEPEDLQAQIKEADINNDSLTNSISSTSLGLSYKTHSEAIYTSRLLDFNNLPEPKNSDDYYEQNDNTV
ncbi:hypothetical protein C1646_764117 [Rhizophagus diaphanus]|nr:hypothetical protein C1646_764117 [Rhizophagus diaphanus] [Rhizophagus sp. MUCL 43196]